MNNYFTISNSFLTMLTRAWPASELQFSSEDELFYHNRLFDFCNILHKEELGEDKQSIVLSFIRKSIFNFSEAYTSFPAYQNDFINEVSFLNILIREVSYYFHGAKVKSFFKELLNDIISFSIDILPDKARVDLYSFYDRSGLFEQICVSTFNQTDFQLKEDVLYSFMKTLRRLPQENLFAFFLYPFNNSFFRKNHKLYPDECTPKELYYGIRSGFFSYSPFNNVHDTLIMQCKNISDEIASIGNLDNPIYVLWKIYTDGQLPSVVEYHLLIERMFRH